MISSNLTYIEDTEKGFIDLLWSYSTALVVLFLENLAFGISRSSPALLKVIISLAFLPDIYADLIILVHYLQRPEIIIKGNM